MEPQENTSSTRHSLGARIRRLRRERSFSQRQFAHMVEINRSYLIDVEHGRRNVSIDNLCKIARGLGVSLSELFECVDERH